MLLARQRMNLPLWIAPNLGGVFLLLGTMLVVGSPTAVLGDDFDRSWSPTAAEKSLLALDLDGPGTTFDLLGDQEGASIIFRVRDAGSREKLAVIKLNSRHSQASAEVFAWRMACYLGFPDIVVPAVPAQLKGGALLKLRRLFLDLSYEDPAKEEIRLEIVSNLNDAAAGNLVFSGVIKPWLNCFMFTKDLGTLESMAQSPVAAWLKQADFPPGSGDYSLRQKTRLYKPKGIHYGTISEMQVARDLSNIMVLDAIMGQSDRFAGANLHFWNRGGQRKELPVERKNQAWDLGRVRLLALDNGLAFRGRNGKGLFDLQGLREPGTEVERFDPHTVAMLRKLGKILLSPATVPGQDPTPASTGWAYFGLDPARFSLARYFLQGTLDYVDRLEKVYFHNIYFTDQDASPAAWQSSGG
jgi:hypothetical protein